MNGERMFTDASGSIAAEMEARPRWRPAPFIVASAALHLACGAAAALYPAWWLWMLAAIAGNHLVIIALVFCPRSVLLGPNILRLPAQAAARGEIALTFDDGPDPDITPQVLDLLDRFDMKATFFCIGRKAAWRPDLVRDIVRRGHAVENHSERHVHWFAALGPRRMAREIDAAQRRLGQLSGETPAFFRAPNGFRNPWLDPLLAGRGLRYVSWSRRGFDSVRRNPEAVVRALTRGITAGEVVLMHDGSSGCTPRGRSTVLAALPVVLERVRDAGLTSVTLRKAFQMASSVDERMP